MDVFLSALSLQVGYNAALVAIGAALLGIASGASGAYLFLRKRALVSDAVAHATLPGIGLAFLIMVAFGGTGRFLPGLLLGSAVTAGLGLLGIDWITRRTRLGEDAAIGAVLSVSFGLGIVLLTIIQTMSEGRQAGLESVLLGSTAGMLFSDAVTIAIGGALSVLVLILLRRPMTLVAFDSGFAQAQGVNVRATDLAIMGLVMAVTVTGLLIVGLILIVALLIIPAVTARFWSDRTDRVVLMAGLFGGLSGWIGAAISASAPAVPTGPIIVLVAASFFAVSLICAPQRGVLSTLVSRARFSARVHERQGLLALARSEPIFDGYTLRILRRGALIYPDGVATDLGRGEAARALRDEKRWEEARQIHRDEAVIGQYDGLTAIENVLTGDEIAEIDRRLGPPQGVV
jgi:manganese/zinc/iron transport system permease protein